MFASERTNVKLEITDSYTVRNDMAATLHKNAESWLHLAVSRAPFEVQAIMQVCSAVALIVIQSELTNDYFRAMLRSTTP